MTKNELDRHVHLLRIVAIDTLSAYIAAAQVANAVDNNTGLDKTNPDYEEVTKWATDEEIVLMYAKEIADDVGNGIATPRSILASSFEESLTTPKL